MTTLLLTSEGDILDACLLWKNSLDQHFEVRIFVFCRFFHIFRFLHFCFLAFSNWFFSCSFPYSFVGSGSMPDLLLSLQLRSNSQASVSHVQKQISLCVHVQMIFYLSQKHLSIVPDRFPICIVHINHILFLNEREWEREERRERYIERGGEGVREERTMTSWNAQKWSALAGVVMIMRE